jgi:hypothetical protein
LSSKPDPKLSPKPDPDPKKIISDPQHWLDQQTDVAVAFWFHVFYLFESKVGRIANWTHGISPIEKYWDSCGSVHRFKF